MKAVVTILQCKRAVLPHVFITGCLPRMAAKFPGEFKAYLIQHEPAEPDNASARLATTRMDASGLERVREWTRRGMYDGATILRHDEWNPGYPMLPSVRRGIEIALQEQADFHVWLEDDALILDEACGRWPALLAGRDVGVYRPGNPFINSAYLVATSRFDERMLSYSRQPGIWNLDGATFSSTGQWLPGPGCLEYFTTCSCYTERAHLREDFAVRVHRGPSIAGVTDMVGRIAPEKVGLLEIDFPQLVRQRGESSTGSLVSPDRPP